MKYLIILLLSSTMQCQTNKNTSKPNDMNNNDSISPKIVKTDVEWKAQLTEEQYKILREKGTEYPGTGEYYMHFEKGTYVCAACKTPLFSSDNKFESHCGWPSFDDAIEGKVLYQRDNTHGMIRTEIVCATCGGHLGHVFDDGPVETTGQRYCVNSVSIEFKK